VNYLKLIRIVALIAGAAAIALVVDGFVKALTCAAIAGLIAAVSRETTRYETSHKRTMDAGRDHKAAP
jgi:hypothetical protein